MRVTLKTGAGIWADKLDIHMYWKFTFVTRRSISHTLFATRIAADSLNLFVSHTLAHFGAFSFYALNISLY